MSGREAVAMRRGFASLWLLLAAALGACTGTHRTFAPAETAMRTLSPDQTQLRRANGAADLFIIAFKTEEIDSQTLRLRTIPPRITEGWIFLRLGQRATFDNGALTKLVKFDRGPHPILTPTTLYPEEFDANLTPAQVETRFGKPDQIERMPYGKRTFVVDRYLKKGRNVVSFTFLGDRIQSIVAGFAILPKNRSVK